MAVLPSSAMRSALTILACAAGVRASESAPPPSLLVIQSLAPWQELVGDEVEANMRWFAESCYRIRCGYKLWRTLPPGREEYHPWFSRFYLGALTLSDHHPEPYDYVLWLDSVTVLSRSGPDLEGELIPYLASTLEQTPLLLSLPGAEASNPHTPKAYVARNSSAALEALETLSSFLPREDRLLAPRGSPIIPTAYPYDGDKRAQAYGTLGQIELGEAHACVRDAMTIVPEGVLVSAVEGHEHKGKACNGPLARDWPAQITRERRRTLLPAASEGGGEGSAGARAAMAPFIAFFGGCEIETRRGLHATRLTLAHHNELIGAEVSTPPPTPPRTASGGAGQQQHQGEEEQEEEEAALARRLVARAQVRRLVADGRTWAEGMHTARSDGEEGADPPLSRTPRLLLIAYGAEYARERTPVMVRSLAAARTGPLHVYVLGDPEGIRAFRQVVKEHVVDAGLGLEGDVWSLFTADACLAHTGLLARLHPGCHQGGYAYLFYKLFASELFPGADHLAIIDSDAIIHGDVRELWAVARDLGQEQFIAMAPDQSHRYYYRLSDPADPIFSPGWLGVPQRTGVNGGLMVMNLARMRRAAFADKVAAVTHEGWARRDRDLMAFCDLAEQDTINWIIAREPGVWRHLDCRWNFMATDVGGHKVLVTAHGEDGVPVLWDTCPQGPMAADRGVGDLLGCTCGARAQIVHFVGGVRKSPLRMQLTLDILGKDGQRLRHDARVRRGLEEVLPGGGAGGDGARASEAAAAWSPEGGDGGSGGAREGMSMSTCAPDEGRVSESSGADPARSNAEPEELPL